MKTSLIALLTLLLISCGGENSESNSPPTDLEENNPSALNVPNGFDYKMDRDIQFNLQVLDHNGVPGKFIGIQIYEPSKHVLSSDDVSAPSIAPAPVLIYSGQTNSTGYLEEIVRIPMHLESVQVQVSQLGINNRVALDVDKNVISHEFK
jgi:hypothetical protein